MKKLTHLDLMADVETLSIKKNAAIIQLSGVVFHRLTGKVFEKFDQIIDPASCLKYGLVLDESTVSWWLKQDKKLIGEVFIKALKEGNDLKNVMRNFNTFVENAIKKHEVKSIHLWGNGILSDNRWIENAYDATGVQTCFHFAAHKDVRTLVQTGRDILDIDIKKEVPFTGNPHNALDDCLHQIKYCVKINKELLKLKRMLGNEK